MDINSEKKIASDNSDVDSKIGKAEYDRKIAAILAEVDEVAAGGKYSADWESLATHPVPEWYKKARFGVFIHWGAYSVPAFINEWYPRLMHYRGNPVYWHHVKKYGRDFPYLKFIEMFTAPRFSPEEWISAVKGAGARFIMPVAEHHDGYKMYDSALSRWTTPKQAMHRDVIGELKAAAEKEGLVFTTSSHRAEHFWFLNGARTLGYHTPALDDRNSDLYGPMVNVENKNDPVHMQRGERGIVPTEEWLKDWLAHTAELVKKYRPKALYFDWWVWIKEFRPYMKKFLAYYYNLAETWGEEVVVEYKSDALMYGAGVYDRERGQLDGFSPEIWQSDTSTAKNSWCHATTNIYKKPADIAAVMADVISKNGVFVLNIGPKADGTLAEKDVGILAELGRWTSANAEALFESSPYKRYGEGRRHKAKSFGDNLRYTSRDIRYTYKPSHVYAFVLRPSKRGVYKLKSFRADRDECGFIIKGVTMNGKEVKWLQTAKALIVTTPPPESDMPVVFDISID